jgi:hypothetical protein
MIMEERIDNTCIKMAKSGCIVTCLENNVNHENQAMLNKFMSANTL